MIKTRVTKLTVTPGELFHERGFEVEIVDEAGGEFVEVRSNESGSPLRIDPDEWPYLRDAIDRMFGEIAENECGCAKGKQTPPAETSEAGGGWIPWNGGECPVGKESRVIVKIRAAGLCGSSIAGDLRWRWAGLGSPSGWDSDNDIIAYKVVD